MAERRMISKNIVNSDVFGDMPATSRLLYFYYLVEADDDGFVINPKQIMRSVGATEDDVKVLILKHYIMSFESGVIVITHWLIQNAIRHDRYKPTQCVDERKLLGVNEKKEYYLLEDVADKVGKHWLPNVKPTDVVVATQSSVEEDSLEKSSTSECKYKLGSEKLTEESYNTLIGKYGKAVVDSQIHRIISHPYYGCLNEERIDRWCEEACHRPVIEKRQTFGFSGQREYGDEDLASLERALLAEV